MAGIQLIALDLDGTTLNSQHKLTEKTCSTLRNLSTLGLTIAIVTGRSKTSAIQYIQDLNLSRPVPIICYNGSMCFIIDGKTECKIFSMPIPADPARTLLQFAEKLGLVAQVIFFLSSKLFGAEKFVRFYSSHSF
jgi:HAD superfamily hydrolase (TIGR01484 family)